MEQMNIFDYIRKPYKIPGHIRLIELFGGIGAQAKALENLHADFEHWRLVEFDAAAVRSYNAIHGTNFETSDITKIHADDLQIVNTYIHTYIMCYSFPCQSLSVAGKMHGMKRGSGTRSGLLWEVERILKECKELPQILLMENVIQVHSEQNMPDFQEWISFLESLGYSNYWQDMNAQDYGMPQHRKRTIMISILGEYNFKFPKPVPLKTDALEFLETETDDRYYLSGERAEQLLVMAEKKSIIDRQTDRQTDRQMLLDGYIENPKPIQVANCITTRQRGCQTRQAAENIVCKRIPRTSD